MYLFKCITGLVSENPLAVTVLTSPKNSWNLQKSTFIILFHHSEPNKLSQKKLFLTRSEILGLLVNTLTANYEYSRSNRENLPLPIQINLSKKPYIFCCIFFYFQCSEKKKKNEPHRSSISISYWLQKMCLFKCIKGLVSENPLAVNVLILFQDILLTVCHQV